MRRGEAKGIGREREQEKGARSGVGGRRATRAKARAGRRQRGSNAPPAGLRAEAVGSGSGRRRDVPPARLQCFVPQRPSALPRPFDARRRHARPRTRISPPSLPPPPRQASARARHSERPPRAGHVVPSPPLDAHPKTRGRQLPSRARVQRTNGTKLLVPTAVEPRAVGERGWRRRWRERHRVEPRSHRAGVALGSRGAGFCDPNRATRRKTTRGERAARRVGRGAPGADLPIARPRAGRGGAGEAGSRGGAPMPRQAVALWWGAAIAGGHRALTASRSRRRRAETGQIKGNESDEKETA